MMSGLVHVNASFNLPKWQALKMIFFAPCIPTFNLMPTTYYFVHNNIQLPGGPVSAVLYLRAPILQAEGKSKLVSNKTLTATTCTN